MTRFITMQEFLTLGRRALLWGALLVSAQGFAQSAASNCPPQPAEPTRESIQALAKAAKDRGFLWKIEKDGKASHLYGSIHLGKQAWSVPGPKTLEALVASDVIALELDILDPAIQAQMADPAKFGIKFFDLPVPLKNRMAAAAQKVCAPMEQFAALHPVMQLMTVTLLDARFSALEISYGSEIFIAGFARGLQKPVESLESVELQLRLLMDGEPKETIEAIDHSITLLENGKSRTVIDRMTNAWANGNLNELQDYQKWCECVDSDAERKALQSLNDERNPGLAAGIDKLMRSGKSVFAAVGALHMTGAKALPKLLAEMGYKVERVAFQP